MASVVAIGAGIGAGIRLSIGAVGQWFQCSCSFSEEKVSLILVVDQNDA